MENTFNFEQASYGDLLVEAKRINDELVSCKNKQLYYDKALSDLRSNIATAGEVVQRLIEDGTISDEDDIQTLIRTLDLNIEREVEIEISVRITGTVRVAYGEEPSEYDVEIGDVSYNGNYIDHLDVDVESVDFSE